MILGWFWGRLRDGSEKVWGAGWGLVWGWFGEVSAVLVNRTDVDCCRQTQHKYI